MAREAEYKASLEKSEDEKKELIKLSKELRNQCRLLYAGLLFYDKKIILWTNNSGHFLPKQENSVQVNLPDELFISMDSNKVKSVIDDYIMHGASKQTMKQKFIGLFK